ILSPFILVIHESFSYTCGENECEELSALRETDKPATGWRRRRLLFARTSQPAPAPPRHGPSGGSQQGYQPDAAAGESAAHFGGAGRRPAVGAGAVRAVPLGAPGRVSPAAGSRRGFFESKPPALNAGAFSP